MPIRLHDRPPQGKRYKHTLRKSPYFVSLIFLLVATALTLANIYVADLIYVRSTAPGPTRFETKYAVPRSRCNRALMIDMGYTSGSPSALPSSDHGVDMEAGMGLMNSCTRTHQAPNSTVPHPSSSFWAPSHPLPLSMVGKEADGPIFPPEDPPIEDESGGWVCQAFPTKSECEIFGEKFCVLWSTAGYASQLSLVPCLASLMSLLFIFLHRGQRTARARARRQQWKLVSGTMLIHFVLQVLSFSLILHVFRTDMRFETPGSHLDQSFTYGVLSAVASLLIVLLLTFTGIAARRGKPWAAGKSARTAERHRRTRSGRIEAIPSGTPVAPDEVVTVGEVEAAGAGPGGKVGERTGLLSGQNGEAAGGGARATDSNV